jgi:hypothetical protein
MYVKQMASPDKNHVSAIEARPSVDLELGMGIFIDLVSSIG